METSLELRFDRYLLPSTAIRQSVAIYTGNEDLGVFAQPEYDLVERVLVYKLPAGTKLEPGVRYTVEVLTPKEEDADGFRAFDGAALEEGEVPLTFDFRTRKIPSEFSAKAPNPYSDCDTMLEALARAGCSSNSCHGGDAARMGLRLDNWQGVDQTAIGAVAHQTDTGTGNVLENPPRMGVNMPIVDPGRPENSYLMYKLLRNPSNFSGNPEVDCTKSVHNVPLPSGTCPEPSAAESQRLASYFVRGLPMPYNDRSAELRPLQDWIRAAATNSAVVCKEPLPPPPPP